MTHSTPTRRGGIVAMLAAGALLLGACSSGGSTPEAGDDSETMEAVPVTIGAVFTTAAVPLWIAEEEGFFEEYGLDATITQAPNFAASAPSLLNGQMQFANAATAPTTSTAGVPSPAASMAWASVPSVATTWRWSGSVADWIAAAGVSGARPAAIR